MRIFKRKLGVGSISILLVLLGLAWSINFPGGFCVGDWVLNVVGLKAWSEMNNMGVHFTVYYSLLFFVAAFLLGYWHKNDFGAKSGKIVSLVMFLLIALATVYTVIITPHFI